MTETNRHARREIPSDGGAGGTVAAPDRSVSEGESIQSAVDSASAGEVVGIRKADATERETGTSTRGQSDGVAGVWWYPCSDDPFERKSNRLGSDNLRLPGDRGHEGGERR